MPHPNKKKLHVLDIYPLLYTYLLGKASRSLNVWLGPRISFKKCSKSMPRTSSLSALGSVASINAWWTAASTWGGGGGGKGVAVGPRLAEGHRRF
jgi:hypothetical protein